jgi:outer membrane murein-binding lipoprotein Lpp
MDAFFWAALAFFVLAGVAGAVFAGVRALATWQAFVSFAAAGAVAVERLEATTAELEARSDELAGRVEELNAAVGRLRRTQARARILLGAWGEVTSLLRTAHVFSPRS